MPGEAAHGANQSGAAERTLVRLLRSALGRSFAVTAARIYGGFLAVSMAATIWVASRGYGLDGTALSLLAEASSLLVWIAGGIAAVGLAAPPKDEPFRQAVLVLAGSRGMGTTILGRAEVVATIRLLGEVIALPILAVELFVVVVVASGPIGRDAWPLAGTFVFGLVAAVVLGLVVSACRIWGQGRGRSWLLAAIVVPWLLAELVLPANAVELGSIPGLLGLAWGALTAGGG